MEYFAKKAFNDLLQKWVFSSLIIAEGIQSVKQYCFSNEIIIFFMFKIFQYNKNYIEWRSDTHHINVHEWLQFHVFSPINVLIKFSIV